MATIHRLKTACTGFARKTNTIANKKRELKALAEPLKEDKQTIVELMRASSINLCESGGMVFELKETSKKPTVTCKVMLQLFAEFLGNDDDYQRFVQRLDQFRDTNTTSSTVLKTKVVKEKPHALGMAPPATESDDDDATEDLDEIFS